MTIKPPLTYAEIGATRADSLPTGYHHLDRELQIGLGRESFARASAALLTWQMHERAGLIVLDSDGPAAPGINVRLGLGRKPLLLTARCRVVYVIEEENRRGFAYGTLPGHPECGEESFTLSLTAAGEIHARIRAFSRPATALSRLGGSLTRSVQHVITSRYLTALKSLANEGNT